TWSRRLIVELFCRWCDMGALFVANTRRCLSKKKKVRPQELLSLAHLSTFEGNARVTSDTSGCHASSRPLGSRVNDPKSA
ncbi:18220_t:CDS:2, partial [Acaulospora morrowiae]